MKLTGACTALSLCFFSLAAVAADPKVAAAQKALDTARANMATAVQRIEADPPSNADLDAAHAAVEALKVAIEAGAEQEQNDLDYAKAVLAARKELREKRAYVDQRRSNIRIFDARRAIEATLPKVVEKAKKLEAKDPDPKDFDDARAAVVEVRKVVDGARAFGKDDPKFAAFITETDANLTKREKAIDDRATALSVGKQKPLLDEARQGLSAAIAALGKGATDEQFANADKAVSALTKRLEEGKDLETRDPPYKGEATKARGELTAGKKKLDELFSATGLARLKAEIEPARKDLATAAKGVRGRKPTPEQMAEARTAAIVVRKLVEKFQPEAARSQAFAQYVTEVQSLLVDVEGELAKRNLDVASADVNQALKAIAKPAPSDEAFAEANSALGILEKTLSGVESKEPYVTDARALLRDARSSTARRRIEVDVEKLRATMTPALAALSNSATDAQFDDARRAVAALSKRLDDEKELETKDAAYRPAAAKVRSELAQANKRIDDLWGATGLSRLKGQIEPAKKDLAAAARFVRGKKPTAEQLAEAKTAAIVARKLVEKLQPEAAKAPAFAQTLTDVQALVVEVETELQRRALESASADVNQALKAIVKPGPTDEAFAEANSALGILEKTLSGVESKEPYVTDARALFREARSSTSRRRIEVDVEKLRATMTPALAALSNAATDAQFDDARRAVAALTKRLDDEKELEGKDAAYRPEAAKVRSELAQANKRIDDLWGTTGLFRLKGQIEPARKDLAAAARFVRGKRPTADQLAEAKTAAIVARKLVEKLQPEAAKTPAFEQTLTDVQGLVVEVETELQKRALESASNDVNQALKAIAKNNPPDEVFEEANAAVGILEKTLAATDAKNALLSAHLGDAKALIRDAKSSTSRRRIEVDVERQKAKVEDERKKVAAAMEVLTRAGFTREQEQAAEDAVAALKTALEAGTGLVAKDRGYAAYDRELKARITELGVKLTARKVTLTAGEGRAKLVELTGAAKARLDEAKQPESTDAQLTAATQAVDALTNALDGNAALEQQDYGYYAQANKGRDDLIKLMEALERAKAVREIRKHTVEPLSAGTAAVNSAASADLRTQKAQYEKAIALFKSCTGEGGPLLRDYPTLTTVPVVVDGRPTTPTAALAACVQQIGSTEVLLKQVVPLLSFEDGPKKAYEAAKGLLAKGKKPEALAQFDECIATAVILSAKSPELKERKFSVAGSDTTLPELIQVCRAQSKTLRGK